MSSVNFLEFSEGYDVQDAFYTRVEELEAEYGDEEYNGTMSTCELFEDEMPVLTDVFNPGLSFDLAEEYAQNCDYGDKWIARPLDLGEMEDNNGKHMYAFYGHAADAGF